MSEGQERQFKVDGGRLSPFTPSKTLKDKPHGPSASHWGLQHLNWLHVHFAVGCSWEELFSTESELPQSGKIATYLERRLGADWKWIYDTKHPDSLSIYALFQSLVLESMLEDDWRTSAQASSHPDSASSSESISPRQGRQHVLSRHGKRLPKSSSLAVTILEGVTMTQAAKERISLFAIERVFQIKCRRSLLTRSQNAKLHRPHLMQAPKANHLHLGSSAVSDHTGARRVLNDSPTKCSLPTDKMKGRRFLASKAKAYHLRVHIH